jgi:hypothetical protein
MPVARKACTLCGFLMSGLVKWIPGVGAVTVHRCPSCDEMAAMNTADPRSKRS